MIKCKLLSYVIYFMLKSLINLTAAEQLQL